MIELLDNYTFVAKKGIIFYASNRKGIFPLFDCLMKNREKMIDAEIADKVVGIGAARLLSYAKIKELYTILITDEALELLIKNNIDMVYKNKIKKIMNKDKTDLCPVEKLSQENDDIDDFIDAVKGFIKLK